MFQGIPTLRAAAAKRKTELTITAGDRVHVKCRRVFTKRPRSPSPNAGPAPAATSDRLRPRNAVAFDYRHCCLLCGRIPTEVSKIRHQVSQVETFHFQDTLQEAISNRVKPEHARWNEEVGDRLTFAIDLPALDTIYHRVCFSNFVTRRSKPAEFDSEHQQLSKKKRLGAPRDTVKLEAFREMTVSLVDNHEGEMCSTYV